MVSNIVDGLSELQINNMQSYQLAMLDTVGDDEMTHRQGIGPYINRVWRKISSIGVFDFVSEVSHHYSCHPLLISIQCYHINQLCGV